MRANASKRRRTRTNLASLVAPHRAILLYYRCDTPYRAILFKGGWHSPKMVRYPPLVLSFTKAYLRDTLFCNISRDNCAIPPPPKKKQARKSFAILSLQVSRDMKSIVAGPLSWRVPNPPGPNPLVAERAFPTSDHWGRTGVARCAEEMTGI